MVSNAEVKIEEGQTWVGYAPFENDLVIIFVRDISGDSVRYKVWGQCYNGCSLKSSIRFLYKLHDNDVDYKASISWVRENIKRYP